MATNYIYRELSGLTKFLKTLLILGAVLGAGSICSSLMQLDLLGSGHFTREAGRANDVREQVIGLFQLALFVFTTVIFGRWIVRAHRNVRAQGAQDLRITPGWALGYFFVPIVNLWRPYQAMCDLWKASHNPATWAVMETGPILGAWWILWIGSGILGRISIKMTAHADGIAALESATWVELAGQLVHIVLCFVTLVMVLQIANAQKNRPAFQSSPETVSEGIPPPLGA